MELIRSWSYRLILIVVNGSCSVASAMSIPKRLLAITVTGVYVLTNTGYFMAGLHLHGDMKDFSFLIAVDAEAKNKESAKNKIVGWLEPSLALKKNESIILKKVTISKSKDSEDASDATEEPEKEEAQEDEEWDDSWAEEPWDEPETDDSVPDFDWEDEDEDESGESDAEETSAEPEVDIFGLSGLKKPDDEDDDESDWEDDEW